MRISWDEYLLRIAEVASCRSQDEHQKVGCAAMRYDKSIASTGYNGAPPNIEINFSDREERRKRVLHGEINCLKYCKCGEVETLAVTISPCSECIKTISAYKIPRVIFRNFYERDNFALKLAKEFNIELIQIKS